MLFLPEIFRAMFEPNEEQKKELMDNAKTKTKEFLNNMQILLEKNGCGFMVGKKVSRFFIIWYYLIVSGVKSISTFYF